MVLLSSVGKHIERRLNDGNEGSDKCLTYAFLQAFQSLIRKWERC